MAQSSEEELRRRRRRRLTQGLFVGGAAVGLPALLNSLVARRAQNLPDATWGSGDRYRWSHGDITYQRLGEGPAVVLLHAFGPGHSSAEWRGAAERLAPSFEVFAPDLPGWGQSSDCGALHDSELYIQMLRDFLDQVVADGSPGRRVVLVAAGLSAAYAVQTVIDQPSRIAALGLIAPLGMELYGDEPDLKDAVLNRMLRLPILGTSALNVFTSRANIAGYLRRDVFGAPSLVDDALIDLHYLNSHRTGAQEALAGYVSGYLNHGVRNLLPRVNVPTWIAWGRRALSPPVEAADLWISRLPDADLEVFEQAGILPHAESPDEFGRKLEGFLAEHGLDSSDDPSADEDLADEDLADEPSSDEDLADGPSSED